MTAFATMQVELLHMLDGGYAGLAGRASAELLETGLIGGLTTFSTWMFESHRLTNDQHATLRGLKLLISLVLGVAGAWVRRPFGAALWTPRPGS